jgi:dTDP-3-amino-3,4,6-trideoxy-alpha-D-glucose transaminase
MIPANDFARQWEQIRSEALDAFDQVGKSGWYILGDEVRQFEASLAALWGRKFATGVGSGLDAIEISLRILGCMPGDAVLTTPLSAFATTLAILNVGAVPVFADTGPHGLMDLARCRDLLWRRPDIRFFVPVHLYGHALDSEELRSMSKGRELYVVEDCAQSIGAKFRGQPTGNAGHFAATSFYPTKNLGAMGDGGAILTDNEIWHTKAAALRDYGQSAKYRHEYAGYNSRLDELQAALLRRAMLPHFEEWTERRRAIARAYMAGIAHHDLVCPPAPEGSESCWHLFPVLASPERKTAFMEHLRSRGVGCGEHYPFIIPDQPAIAHVAFEFADDCSNARRVAASEVSLPIHPFLTDQEVTQVIDAVNSW